MVFRVVNQAVIGENKTFRAPAVLSVGVNVAFIILTALGFGEKSFPVPEFVTADGITLGVSFRASAFPAQVPGLVLGDEVFRQISIGVQIERYIPGTVIPAILRNQILRVSFLRFCCLGLRCIFEDDLIVPYVDMGIISRLSKE